MQIKIIKNPYLHTPALSWCIWPLLIPSALPPAIKNHLQVSHTTLPSHKVCTRIFPSMFLLWVSASLKSFPAVFTFHLSYAGTTILSNYNVLLVFLTAFATNVISWLSMALSTRSRTHRNVGWMNEVQRNSHSLGLQKSHIWAGSIAQ